MQEQNSGGHPRPLGPQAADAPGVMEPLLGLAARGEEWEMMAARGEGQPAGLMSLSSVAQTPDWEGRQMSALLGISNAALPRQAGCVSYLLRAAALVQFCLSGYLWFSYSCHESWGKKKKKDDFFLSSSGSQLKS